MNGVLNCAQELDLTKYDHDEVVDLQYWAYAAYDEIDRLQTELDIANKVLVKIKELL